ncbi:hypothetical protein C7H19_05925 [Aphanothece hegewaldii CCALA 016]|uniref:TM2 domain-containing protein n=1 Tax=Aphanothece hegewaldii CCALA 016 TaxID=2107694 RepID=A0A2T1M1E9_9CHRO|nr:NINE protein [Aphanothece hegewaldii]PSF38520.1 hypothetical protein C7H19_05925 [Aphanothece hegewaldii CCALA 016]
MKNKVAATLLVFFLGGFGIHKFYLGETLAGVLYLLFFWTFIPSIFAFFDFIGLLIMSEQSFNVKYNLGYTLTQQGNYISPSHLVQESSRDKMAILVDLKKLYDSGVITAEEYEEKRRKYLDSL